MVGYSPWGCKKLDTTKQLHFQKVSKAVQCGRPRFDPLVGPGEFHGLYSPWGRKELDITKELSLSRLFKDKET